MQLPTLQPVKGSNAALTDGVLLAVYAPFGTDATLSSFPDGSTRTLSQHPLYNALLRVAGHGVHVAALIDLVKDDTYLIEIPAFHPGRARVTSQWKERMESPYALAGFLRQAHASHPTSALVLALEGHGAGFLPEIDASQLTARNITDNGRFEWHITATQGSPVLPQGSPLLPQGSPLLPQGSPLLPANHMPLSTWGLGNALKMALAAGVPKPLVIHLNNCFNMSVELLHTIAPYGEYATGYCNYNFFSSGETYPGVFKKLQIAGSASAEELADWFADANRDLLEAKHNHPTIGGVVQLGRMKEIAERIDDLSDALLSALRNALPASRPGVVDMIRDATIAAKQYDTEPGFQLETPDQLTDIYSFATALLAYDFGQHGVKDACIGLQKALEGIKRYGSTDRPWVDTGVTWDFSEKTLAMNIFMPDPKLDGLWDWRSPFYLDVNPDPNLPRVQPEIIDFVKVTDWVDFIVEYHRDAPFKGLLPAAIPIFPIFNAKFVPPRGNPPPPPPPDGATPKPPPAPPGTAPTGAVPPGTAPPKTSAA